MTYMLYDTKSFLRFANQAIRRAAGTHYPLTLHRVGGVLMFYTIYMMVEAMAWSGLLADDVFFKDYRSQEIRQPVFILGNPRSGTTFLHRLLAQDEDTFTTMRLSEILVAPSVTHRRLVRALAQMDRYLGRPVARIAALLARLAQRGNTMHRTALAEPEEDQVLLWHIWSTVMLWEQSALTHGARPYVHFDDEMPDADRHRIMCFYSDCIRRHLFAKRDTLRPGVHYLSKSPAFSGRIGTLKQTFPDAQFIYLVRNPLKVIPSYVSLLSYAWSYFGVTRGGEVLRDFVVSTVRHWYSSALAQLDRAPAGTAVVVRYNDLRLDAAGTVQRIYDALGFPMRATFADTLDHAGDRARAYRSRHVYSLEGLGLSRDAIIAQFGDIIERFDFSVGPHPM